MTTTLDKINTQRLLRIIQENIEDSLQQLVSQPNDQLTRSVTVSLLYDFCSNLRDRKALYDFTVICDESNNRPSTINDNMLICDVLIQPMASIEMINIRAIVTSAPCTLNLDTTVITKEDNYARYEYAMGILSRK